ncbi:MAG: hypothetical protein J6C28_00425 [Bacilli bacterium]|nr:hypothetical protein [Bacilli bacterium]
MEEENDTNQKREMISNWLLNENTLLLVTKAEDEQYPVASIRYIKYGEVRHKDLAVLTPDIKVEYNEKMIAMFRKEGKVVPRYKLVYVYDTVTQEFVGSSNMHLHYSASKYAGAMPKTLGAKKK